MKLDIKEIAYKGLMGPILEYASPVWDPHGIEVQEELEKRFRIVQLGLHHKHAYIMLTPLNPTFI